MTHIPMSNDPSWPVRVERLKNQARVLGMTEAQVQRLHRAVREEALGTAKTYDVIFRGRLDEIASGVLSAEDF